VRFEVARGIHAGADAVGGSGENDGAGEERGGAGQKSDEGGDVEDHVDGVGVLHGLVIDNGFDGEGVGIGDFVGRDDGGAEGAKGIEGFTPAPLGAAPLFLPVARGDIVGAGVAENVGEGVFLQDVFGFLSDDDGKFAFPVNFMAGELGGDLDRVAGILDGRDVLHEEDGKFGDFGAGFFGVLSIVEADAHDHGGHQGGKELFDGDFLMGDGVIGEDVALDAKGGAIELIDAVVDLADGILEADDAHGLSGE